MALFPDGSKRQLRRKGQAGVNPASNEAFSPEAVEARMKLKRNPVCAKVGYKVTFCSPM